MAIGVSVPLLLRGPATVGNWAPHGVITPPADLYTQIAALNEADRVTGPAIAEGLRERGFTGAVLSAAVPSSRPAIAMPFLRWHVPPARCCARRMVRALPRWRSAAGTRTSHRCRG